MTRSARRRPSNGRNESGICLPFAQGGAIFTLKPGEEMVFRISTWEGTRNTPAYANYANSRVTNEWVRSSKPISREPCAVWDLSGVRPRSERPTECGGGPERRREVLVPPMVDR